MSILDVNGNPINRATMAALREPQTATMQHLQRELANHQARGLKPSKLNDILDRAERGDITAQHELFLDMEERDAHIFAEMDKRKRAVYKLDWSIKPPRNASKAEEDDAAWLTETLEDIGDLEDLFRDLLDAIGHGFSAVEIQWHLSGGQWLPLHMWHRSQAWFTLDEATRTELRLRDAGSVDGVPLTPMGWIVHKHAAKSGYIARSGLHRVLVWPFLLKAYALGDLAEFLEIYGLPMRLGKYPPTATMEERLTLLRAVTGIGHDAAGIIPQGMTIDFMEAAQGNADPFELMVDVAERSESKAIVGQTLSSSTGATGMGSGVADLHREVRQDIRDSDAKQLAGTATRQLLWPLLVFNRGARDPRRAPQLVFDTQESEDITAYADALPKLVSIGMRIKPDWAHDKLRIPMAEEGEPVLQAAPAPVPPEDKGTPLQDALRAMGSRAIAALRAESASPYPDQAALDGALATLRIQDTAQRFVAPAVQALTLAGSYEGALALLESEQPLIDVDVLGEALARAMFAGEAHGYASLREEVRDEVSQVRARPVAAPVAAPAALTATPPTINVHLTLPPTPAAPARRTTYDAATQSWVSEVVPATDPVDGGA